MKNLQLKDSDWRHPAGSIVCPLSGHCGVDSLEEQSSRLRFAGWAELPGRTSNSQIVFINSTER